MMENSNIDVFVSDIPPAIRAATVYVEGTPIWSATQSYQFMLGNDNHLELSRPKESLIATCSEKSSKRDFDGIVRCFEREFKRLTDCSVFREQNHSGDVLFPKTKGKKSVGR